VVVCWQKKPPPSHVSSKGGVEGVLTRETPPPSRVSSKGGVEGVLTRETPPPSRVLSKGGVGGSDCQGFQNPQGSGVGSVGVRVRVGIYVPLKNPYPWQGKRVSTRPKFFAYIDLKMVFFLSKISF